MYAAAVRSISAILVLVTTVGCGREAPAKAPATVPVSASPAPLPEQAPADTPPIASAGAPAALPTTCANSDAHGCTPPSPFVERLCDKAHQDVALDLLRGGTVFTRLYLRGRLDELVFDEEVLAPRFHAPSKTGMVVGSGLGTYDVLRWDGSCATGVEAEAVTQSRPPSPRAARVKWHRIAPKAQDALIAGSDAVKRAHAKRGKECRGAMTGDVSAACEKADALLSEAVVDYVRHGGRLPAVEF